MSLKTQAKVLRILQERKFERVGGTRTIEVDVRVIAATNKNLEEEIQKGSFREDLFYRLNVLPFHVPPLRERREDIASLVKHFLAHFSRQESREDKTMAPDAMKVLQNYSWPGNVRELKNLIERLVIMTPGTEIRLEDLPANLTSRQNSSVSPGLVESALDAGNFREAKEEFEREYILRKLQENEWNISRTAEEIDLERSNLHRKIKTHGIELKK